MYITSDLWLEKEEKKNKKNQKQVKNKKNKTSLKTWPWYSGSVNISANPQRPIRELC